MFPENRKETIKGFIEFHKEFDEEKYLEDKEEMKEHEEKKVKGQY